MTATQPGLFDAVTKRDHAKTHVPAHECVALGVCYLCAAPCEVETAETGHITVPWCGCGRVEVEDK